MAGGKGPEPPLFQTGFAQISPVRNTLREIQLIPTALSGIADRDNRSGCVRYGSETRL